MNAAQARKIFIALSNGPFAAAKVTCTYQTDTFTGLRNMLSVDSVASVYGVGSDYQFSIFADKSDLTTEVKTDEKITVSGAALGTTGTSPMRVLGSAIDPASGLLRLDLGEEFTR